MPLYKFLTQRGTATSTYDLTCDGDLDARRKAEGSATCIRVETSQGRVVWRKPLTDAEMREIMTRGKLRTAK